MTDTAPAAESTSATPDAAPAATPNVAPETPPWGEDFNAERAWTLVQNLRADKDKLSGKVGEFEKAAQDAAEAIPGKPTPKLTAGHESSDAGDAFDPLALAEKVHKRLI